MLNADRSADILPSTEESRLQEQNHPVTQP